MTTQNQNTMQQYFKRPEPNGYFPDFPNNYYEVSDNRQLIVNFLNRVPIIQAISQEPGAWPDLNEAVLEVGIRIEKSEFMRAYNFALNHKSVELHT